MTIFGRTVSRLAIMVTGIILILALIAFATSQCAMRRNAASQARVDASQAGAASDSAKDAIGAVARSGEEQAASEQLTRDNEREIRGAPGADARVSPEVAAAGRRALCKRAAYRDAPRCAAYRKDAK